MKLIYLLVASNLKMNKPVHLKVVCCCFLLSFLFLFLFLNRKIVQCNVKLEKKLLPSWRGSLSNKSPAVSQKASLTPVSSGPPLLPAHSVPPTRHSPPCSRSPRVAAPARARAWVLVQLQALEQVMPLQRRHLLVTNGKRFPSSLHPGHSY